MEYLAAMWIGFVCAISSAAPIGPVSFAVAQATMTQGRKSGLLVGAGGMVADVSYACLALLISDWLVGNENPLAFKWLNIVSIPVVILVGYKMIKTRHEDHSGKKVNVGNNLFQGMFLGLSNPGLLFYWVGAVALAQSGGWLENAQKVWGGFAIGVAVGIALALVLLVFVVSIFAKNASQKIIAGFTLLVGTGFILFGVALLVRVFVLYVF